MIIARTIQILGDMISVPEAKNYLKLDTEILEDDILLTMIIAAAYTNFAAYTGIAPILTEYECRGYSSFANTEMSPRIPAKEITDPSSPEIALISEDTISVPVGVEYFFKLKAGYETTPDNIREALFRAIAEMYIKRSVDVDLTPIFYSFRRSLI